MTCFSCELLVFSEQGIQGSGDVGILFPDPHAGSEQITRGSASREHNHTLPLHFTDTSAREQHLLLHWYGSGN